MLSCLPRVKFIMQYNRITALMQCTKSTGLGYAEILRHVNLDTLNVRRESICQEYVDKIKVGTHILNYLLPDKRHSEYNIRHENVYPLSVTRTNRFRKSFIPWALYNCQ